MNGLGVDLKRCNKNESSMNIETALCLGFVFHLVGDYLLQNDWMANEKTKDSLVCGIHCVIYTLPFAIAIFDSPFIWIVLVSHFFIDRFRLATYWIKLVNWSWGSNNFGYKGDKPIWMSFWLMIIIDNTFHIIFNSIAIYLDFKMRQ